MKKTNKQRLGNRILTFILVSVIFICIVGCEKIHFESAMSDDTIESITSFLKKYPSSSLADSAEKRLELLTDWDSVVTNGSVNAYNEFINRFPGTDKAIFAHNLLDSIENIYRKLCLFSHPFIIDDPILKNVVRDYGLSVPNKIKLKSPLKKSTGNIVISLGIGYQYNMIPSSGFLFSMQSTIWSDAEEQTYIDTVSIGAGYTFISSRKDPLTFRLDRNYGWVYLEGTGSVKKDDSLLVELPYFSPINIKSESISDSILSGSLWGSIDAIWSDCCLGSNKNVDEIKVSLTSENWIKKMYAIKALGAIKDTSAVKLLSRFLEDNDRVLRRHAAWAIGNIGVASTEIFEQLNTISISDKDLWSRKECIIALMKLSETKSMEKVLNLSKSKNQEDRYVAALVFISYRTPETEKALLKMYNNEQEEQINKLIANSSILPLNGRNSL